MVWRKATNKSDLEKCLEIIKGSAEHYSSWNLEKINKGINRKRGEMYYYDSDETKIALMFQWNYTKKMWRIKHGAYQGGDPIDAMKITWDKVKKFLRNNNTDRAYILIYPVENFKQSHKPYFNYLKSLEEITVKKYLIIDKWEIRL